MDSISEKYVKQILRDLVKQGKTIIVIAHRLSTVKNADSIIVLEEGKVSESGTHQELLQKEGVYRKLWNDQFLKRRQLYNILEEFKDYGANILYNRYKSTFYYTNDFEILVKINVNPLSGNEQRSVFAGCIKNNSYCAIALHKLAVV